MSEFAWMHYGSPVPMLRLLEDRVSDRKLRLFAVACCRRISYWIKNPDLLTALDVAEQYADSRANLDELAAAREPAVAEINEAFGRWWLGLSESDTPSQEAEAVVAAVSDPVNAFVACRR